MIKTQFSRPLEIHYPLNHKHAMPWFFLLLDKFKFNQNVSILGNHFSDCIIIIFLYWIECNANTLLILSNHWKPNIFTIFENFPFLIAKNIIYGNIFKKQILWFLAFLIIRVHGTTLWMQRKCNKFNNQF